MTEADRRRHNLIRHRPRSVSPSDGVGCIVSGIHLLSDKVLIKLVESVGVKD